MGPEDRVGTLSPASKRCAQVVEAASAPGARVVLVGDPGSGKAYLAEQAARELVDAAGLRLSVEVLLDPPRPESGVASVFTLDHPEAAVPGQPPSVTAGIIGARMRERAGEREVVLVVRDVDALSALDAQVLEVLARDPELRIIATGRRLTSAAERMWQGPAIRRIQIGPFDLEESGRFLASLLRVERVEDATLRMWHEASGGYPYPLEVLALACERSGELRRSRGTAWSTQSHEEAPSEFAERLMGACTDTERAVLEIVALAEPISEGALLGSLDAVALTGLYEQGLLRSRTRDGGTAVVIGRPLLAASLRSGITPLRRIQLNDRIFRVLDEDRGAVDPVHLPERLMRLVAFGLEGGRDMPIEWLWAAFELTMRTGDPRLVLRIAIAVAVHPDADASRAGHAAVQAARLAQVIGDPERLRVSRWMIEAVLADEERIAALDPAELVGLRTALIRHGVWENADVDAALGELDAIERGIDAAADGALLTAEAVRSTRTLVLSYAGRIGAAAAAAPESALSSDLRVEWVRAPARAVGALIMLQQGALREALESAEHARTLSQLGPQEQFGSIDVQGFCWLLGSWVSGDAELGREVLAELGEATLSSTHAETRYSGLIEAGSVLLDVQTGRWREAAERSERLAYRLSKHDGYGIAPLVRAAEAYACAVLGEQEAATRALRAASVPVRGIGQALAGHRRLLMLRAREWLRLRDVSAEARELAEWAREEGLSLIELQALHSVAFATRSVSADHLARAREAATRVDEPLGSAFVAHIERIAEGTLPGGDEPEVRLLAEIGIWLPLPAPDELTAREHEVMLFASLGYSSKFIAERLHISVRTVETHLSRVFAKLGLESRDELRQWAARQRSVGRGPKMT